MVVLIIPSMEGVENSNGKPGRYKYNPKPISLEALKEYYALKDYGNVEALNAYNKMYNKPKSVSEFVGPEADKRLLNQYKEIRNICEDPTDYGSEPTLSPIDDYDTAGYQHYPSHYPKEGSTVAQGYYTQGNDQKDDSDESDTDPWDGSYFPSPDQNDF